MTTPVEAQIIELHLRHYTQDLIVATLKTGKPRVSRCIKEFHRSGVIPGALRIGRPSKRSSDLVAFVEARTLQSPSMSSSALSDEIATEFGVHVSRTTVNNIRKGLRFKYRPLRHNQALTDLHKLNRLEFCRKMLRMPESLPLIHFSDESRLILGDDKRWIWYRHGEDNPGASISSVKFPASVMIFAVIGIGFKSDLLLVDGSIDTDRYIQNLDRLGFINALDQRHGPFGWIFWRYTSSHCSPCCRKSSPLRGRRFPSNRMRMEKVEKARWAVSTFWFRFRTGENYVSRFKRSLHCRVFQPTTSQRGRVLIDTKAIMEIVTILDSINCEFMLCRRSLFITVITFV
jgi:transposase